MVAFFRIDMLLLFCAGTLLMHIPGHSQDLHNALKCVSVMKKVRGEMERAHRWLNRGLPANFTCQISHITTDSGMYPIFLRVFACTRRVLLRVLACICRVPLSGFLHVPAGCHSQGSCMYLQGATLRVLACTCRVPLSGCFHVPAWCVSQGASLRMLSRLLLRVLAGYLSDVYLRVGLQLLSSVHTHMVLANY
jgi:hypothetical protein